MFTFGGYADWGLLRCSVQGLNIAPALIAYSPVRTVVNPVGPLNIADVLVSDTLPALPGK